MGISALDELPDISYIDGMTLDTVTEMLMSEYKKNLEKITGKEVTVGRCDPYRILLNSVAVMDMQMLLFIDHCGKMNSLKYAFGDYLDHIGIRQSRPRKEAQKAVVTVEFTLDAARQSVEPIPVGTMVTADQAVFFETVEYAEIPAGDLSVQVKCACTVAGRAGNEYGVGEITTLATPTGFIARVSNTTVSAGGTDKESDVEYREGIYNAPNKYSTAGPDEAWVALIKDFDPMVEDVKPTTVPGSGVNTIIILNKHGDIPGESQMANIRDYLMRPDIRTFGINVQVCAPTPVGYGISLVYYIANSDKDRVAEICSKVDLAAAKFTEWQSGKIGRDVNPDELLAMLKQAGVKRAVISEPSFSSVPDDSVAVFNGAADIRFGGVESD